MSGELEHAATRGLAVTRVVAGAAFAVTPRVAGGVLVGADATRPGAELFVRAFGARDLLLGAGSWAALARGADARPWLAACAAADAFDAAAVAAMWARLPPGRRALAFAISLAPALAGVGVLAIAPRRPRP